MKKHFRALVRGSGLLLYASAGFAASASAQDVPAPETLSVQAMPPVSPNATRILDDETLGDTRGGDGTAIGFQSLQARLNSTLVGNYQAGAVSFAGSAFSGFSGMGNIVVNTGAQANLQSAMNLTINLGN